MRFIIKFCFIFAAKFKMNHIMKKISVIAICFNNTDIKRLQ